MIYLDLFDIYKNYDIANKEYISLLENLLNSSLGDCNDENIQNDLLAAKNKFEFLKIMADDILITEENNEILGKLKYYIMDGLFLAVDLLNFYNSKQVERFSMRAVNYINKNRMQEFINDNPFNSTIPFGKCRI